MIQHRNDGFSDDGLSYSVAGDFNKLLGQAMSNYEARATNPQSFQESDADYKQRVASAPDILANELLPLGIVSPVLKNHQPKLIKSGRDIFSQNSNGGLDLVYPGEMNSRKNNPASTVPQSRSQVSDWFRNSPLMQDEESQAVSELGQPGADAFDILGTKHPTLIKNSPYAERFGPIYRDAERRHSALANSPVENVNPNVSALAGERARLTQALNGTGLPDNTAQAYTNRINDIDSLMSQPQATQGEDKFIAVINPKGQNKRIRASQLEQALKMGYRQR